MKTKNIFNRLAFAMLMPAMMLTTACSSSDDNLATNDNENTNKKGYPLQVTINVTREGDDATTRATYNESDRKLEFSAGDKLFIKGSESTMSVGQFAGTLDYDALTGKFSGTITTENKFVGDAAYLFDAAAFEGPGELSATLLPAGYDEIGFLTISGSDYSATLAAPDYTKAVATDKATAVEQFSLEQAGKNKYSYDSGTHSGSFALSPKNAIVSFTLTGLDSNASFAPTFYDENSHNIGGKKIDANSSGTAVFAMGVDGSLGAQNWRLSDGMPTEVFSVITIGSHSFAAGNIYNVTRSVLTYPIAINAVTSAYVGSVITSDGYVYPPKTAVPDGKTAVAVFAYIDGSSNHYAIALQDAAPATWNAITSDGADGNMLCAVPGTWTVVAPTGASWKVATREIYSSIFQNLGSGTNVNGYVPDDTTNAYLTTNVGGTALSDVYWCTSQELPVGYEAIWYLTAGASWQTISKYIGDQERKVRPVLVF